MTGNEIFYKALDICGLRKPDGSLPSDVSDLKQRAVAIINIVIAENSVTDCRIRKCEHSVNAINSLEDNIECSPIISGSVLPYGVARLLMLNEDEVLAKSLEAAYTAEQATAIGFGKARRHNITEVYK